jgi:signal transduction histidine kinase
VGVVVGGIQSVRGPQAAAATAVRILAVEDNASDLALLQAQLFSESGGPEYELRTARTLEEARLGLQAAPADVILLDLNLPDSFGWDTFESVMQVAPDSAIILLSGGDHEELAAKAVKHGAQDYIGKTDLTGRILARAVRHALERKAGELQLRLYQEGLEELVRSRTERIQQTNDALRQEVEERRHVEGELRRAMELLREVDGARVRFVSNVSHDLKTPLSSMSFAIENLLKGVVGPMEEATRSYIVMLQEDCGRILRTVSDVLDFSRIESGRLILHCVRVPFRRLVGHAVTSLGLMVAQKGVSVRCGNQWVRGFVECDPHKMGRVILNIVQNAVKYTPAGGVIDIMLRRAAPPEKGLVLEVSDTGIGIPEEFLPRIAERHFRVGEELEGSGIGLSIAKEIVERHGGRLEVASPVPGRQCGTRVSVVLQEAPPPRVVVAAGDAAVREAARSELAAEGYTVIVSSDGADAWARLSDGDVPQALVMDFSLSAMDGVELIARIKSDPRLQRMPLVVALEKGADGVRRELIEGFRLSCVPVPPQAGETLNAVERATQEPVHAEN